MQQTQDHWPYASMYTRKGDNPENYSWNGGYFIKGAPGYNPYAENYFCCSFQSGSHLPKELNSKRCTLCFARQVWNRDAFLRDVLPANLGSSSALVVTLESILLKKQNPHGVNDDDNPTSAITTTAWRSYVRDRGIIF